MDERLQQLSEEARQAVIDKMTLEQKAENTCLPDYLSIKEIADLKRPIRSFRSPDNLDRKGRQDWRLQWNIENEANKQYKNDLIAACEAGLLKYEGDIKGWEYFGTNTHPLAKNGQGEIFIPDASRSFYYDTRYDLGIPKPVKYKCPPDNCTIHKDEFKRYLQSVKQWPVDGLLANWWAGDEEPQQTDIPTPEPPQPKQNEQDESERSRILAYCKGVWIKDGRRLTAVPFLRELKNHENPDKHPDKGPIYKVVIGGTAGGRGFWFDFGEGEGEKLYKFSTLKNRVTEWRNPKKKSKTDQ